MTLRRLLTVGMIGVSAAMLVISLRYYVSLFNYSSDLIDPAGNLLGGDFICFYIAGKLYLTDPHRVYDYIVQRELQNNLVAGQANFLPLPFVYPPLVAAALSGLGSLSFFNAYLTFSCFSFGLAVISLFLIVKKLTGLSLSERIALFLSALTFPPFAINCLAAGHFSALGLFILALTYLLLKNRWDLLAGAFFSLSYYKPPLFFLFLIFSILHRRWKFLMGFFITGTILVIASCIVLPLVAVQEFLYRSLNYHYGAQIYPNVNFVPKLSAGLFALLSEASSQQVALSAVSYLVLGFFIAIGTWRCARILEEFNRGCLFDLVFALEISVSLMLSLQMVVYDLTLMLLPILITLGNLSYFPRFRSVAVILVSLAMYFEFTYRTVSINSVSLSTAPILLIFWCLTLSRLVNHQSFQNT